MARLGCCGLDFSSLRLNITFNFVLTFGNIIHTCHGSRYTLANQDL
jgi:hypothetical protein